MQCEMSILYIGPLNHPTSRCKPDTAALGRADAQSAKKQYEVRQPETGGFLAIFIPNFHLYPFPPADEPQYLPPLTLRAALDGQLQHAGPEDRDAGGQPSLHRGDQEAVECGHGQVGFSGTEDKMLVGSLYLTSTPTLVLSYYPTPDQTQEVRLLVLLLQVQQASI